MNILGPDGLPFRKPEVIYWGNDGKVMPPAPDESIVGDFGSDADGKERQEAAIKRHRDWWDKLLRFRGGPFDGLAYTGERLIPEGHHAHWNEEKQLGPEVVQQVVHTYRMARRDGRLEWLFVKTEYGALARLRDDDKGLVHRKRVPDGLRGRRRF